MADSSSSGAPKKRFTIPSIAELDKFENDKPKIPSNFRSKNATSNVGSSSRTSTLATHGPSTSSARHETVSRQKDGKDGSNRTSNTSNREQDQHQQGSTSGEGHAMLSSEKAEAIKNNLELRRQRADEALRERLEAGANPRTAASTTSSNLQRTEDSSRHRLPEVANSTSASTSTVSRGSASSNPYRLPSFTSASEFAKRGKIGSSFASKFHMLGTAEEYKIPQTAINQPASETTGAGTSTGSTKVPSGNSVIVNPRQRGNPILKHIRNVPWEFGDVVPDYVMGRTTCAFYLSLRYHNLNPNYISDRLTELGHKFDLRVLLVQVDVKDPHHSVKELARLAILTDCTLILAWNAEEAGRYLETYKAYENKPVDALKEKIEQNHLSKMTDCLTTVKSVNKTDVITLLANCGTFEKIVESSKEELALLPGFGPQKAQRLSNIFTEPFLRRNKRRKIQPEEGEKEDGED